MTIQRTLFSQELILILRVTTMNENTNNSPPPEGRCEKIQFWFPSLVRRGQGGGRKSQGTNPLQSPLTKGDTCGAEAKPSLSHLQRCRGGFPRTGPDRLQRRTLSTSPPRSDRLKVAEFCLLFVCYCVFALNAFAQVAAEISTAALPSLTRAEMEEFLLRAKVIVRRDLSMGITNSQRATLDDGKLKHDAHIQTVDIKKPSFQTALGTEMNFRDCYKFNVAAYELDKLLDLNMVPVSVERKVGNMAAVTWWVDDFLMMELERKKKKIEPPNQHSWNQQMYVCRVFDQLIYNTDRNLGNLLITKDWKVWMIDHTRAFRLMRDLRSLKDLVQCDRRLLAKLRELNKDVLKKQLDLYLTPLEIEGLVARRDKIVKFFDEQIAQKGEAAVLFDLERK